MDDLDGLRAARKVAGQTQEELEALTGIAQGDISKFENGAKLMSETVAKRLAEHLPGTTPSELLLSNKATAFKRAQERGDRVGVLEAAKSMVKYAERLPSDPQLDALLDRLVSSAVKFAEASQDPVYYGADPDEGRNALGVRVTKARSVHDGGEHWDARYDSTYAAFVPGGDDVVLDIHGADPDYEDSDFLPTSRRRSVLTVRLSRPDGPLDDLTGQRRRLEIEHYDLLGEANRFEAGTESM